MTPLAERLATRIAASGPITIAEYMADCLLHPEHGYYTTRTPFGRDGDFITAPEISQMFGELIGLCLAQAWLDRGAPAPFCLAELGPGRGTLMADIWRATARVPGFHDAAQVTLVEASPQLREVQAQALPNAQPQWCDSVTTLPEMPLFLVANEFFDALPIRQFTRTPQSWREYHVGLDNDGALSLGLGLDTNLAALSHRLNDTHPGDVVELCPAAGPILEIVAQRIAAHDGVAIVIDYGDWRSLGDTLQALRAHQPVPVLETPGQADLTAHVDFEALALAATAVPGCAVTQMTPQGAFLEALGIGPRAATLAKGLSGDKLTQHLAAYRRLTDPSEMGTLFKTLGLSRAGSPPVPGLQPWL